MWVDMRDIVSLLPLDVYDASGTRIDRKIKRFDCATGEVESCVLDSAGLLCYSWVEDCIATEIERFLAPLTWRSITVEEAKLGDLAVKSPRPPRYGEVPI
jgi:hypothetical protein